MSSLAIRPAHLLYLSLKLTFYKMFFVDWTVVVFVLLDVPRDFQIIFFSKICVSILKCFIQIMLTF
jgi:hypothetical protein